MEDLILLRDEVAYLQRLSMEGGTGAVGQFQSDSVRADFLAERNLIHRRGETVELTPLGRRVGDAITERHFVEVAILTGYEVEALER